MRRQPLPTALVREKRRLLRARASRRKTGSISGEALPSSWHYGTAHEALCNPASGEPLQCKFPRRPVRGRAEPPKNFLALARGVSSGPRHRRGAISSVSIGPKWAGGAPVHVLRSSSRRARAASVAPSAGRRSDKNYIQQENHIQQEPQGWMPTGRSTETLHQCSK